MSRYIDADKIDYTTASVYRGKDNEGKDVYRRTFVAIKSVVDEIPTADVVEVVRCRDCAYYREENGYCMNPHCSSSFYGHRVREEHYCSFGERRAEE